MKTEPNEIEWIQCIIYVCYYNYCINIQWCQLPERHKCNWYSQFEYYSVDEYIQTSNHRWIINYVLLFIKLNEWHDWISVKNIYSGHCPKGVINWVPTLFEPNPKIHYICIRLNAKNSLFIRWAFTFAAHGALNEYKGSNERHYYYYWD